MMVTLNSPLSTLQCFCCCLRHGKKRACQGSDRIVLEIKRTASMMGDNKTIFCTGACNQNFEVFFGEIFK